jgi:hypothetical protein
MVLADVKALKKPFFCVSFSDVIIAVELLLKGLPPNNGNLIFVYLA